MKWVIGLVLLALCGPLGCSSGGAGVRGSKFATALSRFLTPTGSIKKFDNQTGASIIGAGLGGASDSRSVNTASTSWGSTFGGLRSSLVLDAKADDGTCSAFAGCVQGDACLGEDTTWSVDLACFCGVAEANGTPCQGSGTMSQAWALSVSESCFEGSIEYVFSDAFLQLTDGGFTANGTYFFAMNGCGASQAALAAGDLTSGCMIAMYDLTFNGDAQRAGLKWCAASDAGSASQTLEVLAPLPDDPGQELVLAVGETYTKDQQGNLTFTSGTIEVRAEDGTLTCTIDPSGATVTGTCTDSASGQSFAIGEGASTGGESL
ncbi:MAG: hypothetical protein AMXMBFR64_24540 [Myxococcales bacterium]